MPKVSLKFTIAISVLAGLLIAAPVAAQDVPEAVPTLVLIVAGSPAGDPPLALIARDVTRDPTGISIPADASESTAPRLLAAQATSGIARPPVLTNRQLFAKYVGSTLGPDGWLHATLAGGLQQWRRAPPEWGNGGSGYGKRWASDYAASAIGSTTRYAVARLFDQDPSSVRCDCTGAGPRLGHALLSPFKARTRDGRSVFSLATAAGFAAEDIVPAVAWYPGRHRAREMMGNVVVDLITKIGINVFHEFIPIHRKHSEP